jgi:2-desacetyl-2-hydroxyethyl bacteriochlorophyllide A dehydrogenase
MLEVPVGVQADAFWVTAPGMGAIRAVVLDDVGPGQVLVRTRLRAVSRGTESIVFSGRVPHDQYPAMRAPFQEGDFPGPVKYGYLNVGVVEAGVAALVGRTVFCLYPHQTAYVVPAAAVVPVPGSVPPRRATLAGIVETAVNAVWDARPLLGDRIAVVGAGTVGCCAARLLTRFPGARVTLIDVDPSRAQVAARLGAFFATPDEDGPTYDVVLHASATAAGLQRALELAAPDGEVVELSWYGNRPVTLDLGGGFHSRRLAIRASQVGSVSPARRGQRSPAQRLALAMDLLADDAFDCLITGSSPFAELPTVMPHLVDGSMPTLTHLIDYTGQG